MTQHFAAVSANSRACTTSAKRSGPSHSQAPCFILCSTSKFLFFSLLEKKTRWLHSLPKRQTAVADPWTKQPVKIKALGIFPWQEGGREREELKLCWLKRLLSACLLCRVYSAKAVGTNSVSQYSLGADRLLAARIYPARGQRCGKTNTSSNLGRWRGENDLSQHFLCRRKPASFLPSCWVTSGKLCPLRGGGKKKATYFK